MATTSSTKSSKAKAIKRISKACEPCRARRRKCDGGRPCQTCIQAGTSDTCQIRVKARPKRSLASGSVIRKTPAAEETSNLARLVEEYLTQWLDTTGVRISLQLPNSMSSALPDRLDLSNIPGTSRQRHETFETFLTCSTHHISLLPQGRPRAAIQQFQADPTSLPPDELALVLSFLALGRQIERNLAGSDFQVLPEGSTSEDLVYFRMALQTLDDWGQASATALGALHFLHFFALRNGGREELDAVLGRMTAQCRLLGLHSRETLQLYPQEDELGRLFYLSFYKDTWFCTLSGRKPAFCLGEFEYTWNDREASETFGDHYEESSLYIKLTLLENEAVQIISTTWKFENLDKILDIEGRLAQWQKSYKERDLNGKWETMMSWAIIRYHWLRLMLRFPLLRLSTQTLASLAILTRSASTIIKTYHQVATTYLFSPRWAETRRIVSAAYCLYICWLEGELLLDELKPLAKQAAELLYRSERGFRPAGAVSEAWNSLLTLAGLESEIYTESPSLEQEGREGGQFTQFDFTLPY